MPHKSTNCKFLYITQRPRYLDKSILKIRTLHYLFAVNIKSLFTRKFSDKEFLFLSQVSLKKEKIGYRLVAHFQLILLGSHSWRKIVGSDMLLSMASMEKLKVKFLAQNKLVPNHFLHQFKSSYIKRFILPFLIRCHFIC